MTLHSTRRERREGSILILAVVMTVIIVMAIGQVTTVVVSDSRQAQFALCQTQARALADGVTEAAKKRFLEEVANFSPPTLTGTVDVDGNQLPYTAVAVGPPINRVDDDGVSLSIQPYEITATVEVGRATATTSRLVELTLTPVYQYMILYDDDLEMLPGPNMTLSGRVHSNANIYLGAGNTLTVDTDYLRCTGQILRERKNNGTTTGGTVDIKVFGQSVYENMDPDMDSDHPDWLTLSMDTWQGTVQSGAHGVTEAVVPNIGSIKAFDPDTGDKGHYHENADLVIRDGQAFDTDDNAVALPPGTLSEHTLYDGRENTTITVTQIDIGLLNGSGVFPANGLIYAYRTDATPSQPNGIRLENGSELLAPLTVVSEDPLFIQGDFNTINKKGASVIADAVNLLSNAWDDSKTAGSLPSASSTQFNVAVVTGNVATPDGGGNYSGGFENLPRFHEKWSGVTATIHGSFIKIFASEIGATPWAYGGDNYTAPIRDWHYDDDLQDLANMPPFTPNAVYVRRVMWSDGLPMPFPTGSE